MEEFGLNLRDWFHELQRPLDPGAVGCCGQSPAALLGQENSDWSDRRTRFSPPRSNSLPARRIRPPHWTRDSSYVLDEPWFFRSRAALPGSSAAPKPHPQPEYFTTPEVQVAIRPGPATVSRSVNWRKPDFAKATYGTPASPVKVTGAHNALTGTAWPNQTQRRRSGTGVKQDAAQKSFPTASRNGAGL